MEQSEQLAVDKAHGALGNTRRALSGTQEASARLADKIEHLEAALEAARSSLAESQAAAADLEIELSIREADPLLTYPSSKGEVHEAGAEPATGTGGN